MTTTPEPTESERVPESYEEDIPEILLRQEGVEAGVKFKGALVTSFSVDGVDVLMPSRRFERDGKPKQRGGVPILFPNPGPAIEAGDLRLPQHGFARDREWKLSDPRRSLDHENAFSLKSDYATREQYPHFFLLSQAVKVGGVQGEQRGSLSQSVRVVNSGTEVMPVCFGFHPYFAVDPERKAELVIPGFDAASHDWSGTEDVPIPWQPEMVLGLPGIGSVTVRTSGNFDKFVVWSEPGGRFVCVEPWLGQNESLTDPGSRLELPPGYSETFSMEIAYDSQSGSQS